MYEVLKMYTYALYYFKRAAAIRPSGMASRIVMVVASPLTDERLWAAVGNCYEKLDMVRSMRNLT